MNKRKSLLLLFLCFSYAQTLTAQKLPSTLLWKISGNGLQKSSYLYGTMHLTDERVFNIGDSVYKVIEKTEGFAIEIDPEQFTPFVIDATKKRVIENIRLKDMMQKDEFKVYGKALAKKLGKDENDITTADVLHEKNKWIEESYSQGKMQTFLDIYLFDIARRQGKWTGGVEDLQDQENLLDLIDESDVRELAMSDDDEKGTKEHSLSAFMTKSYVDNNLSAIDSISSSMDSAFTDALLIKRNKKMAMRMDSLSRERSMVFAVGAAHLPGDKGVIELLKERGFTVEPVFSSKKIKPADYKVAKVNMPWYDVKDDDGRYTVSMPGKAGDLTLYGVLHMKMYFDVFQSTIYMTTALQTPYTEKMADSVFSTLTLYYFNTKDYSTGKPITINNVPGREFLSTKNNYSHGYLLFKDGKMYMAIAMCMKKDTSAASSINKFLHSFTIYETGINNNGEYNYVNKLKAYKINVPIEPKSANDMLAAKKDTNMLRDLNIATDPATGAYYFFGTTETARGFSIINDSATLMNIRMTQKEKFSTTTTDTIYVKNGYRVLEIGGMMKQTPIMLSARFQFRGNRWYSLVTMYDPAKGKEAAEKFFNSFQTLDYINPEWNNYTSGDTLFTAWSPGGFNYIEKNSDDEDAFYESYDSSRADNFNVIVQSFNKYYWQNSDSAFWNNTIKNYRLSQYNDSILYSKAISNGDIKGYEFAIQPKGSHNIKRVRKLLNGNKLYSLVTLQDSSEIYNSNNNKFFESFRFNRVLSNNDIFRSKASELLRDISSTDSAVESSATDYLNKAPFTKNDLPLLHEALLKSYLRGDDNYDGTRKSLKRIIIGFKDTSSYTFAKEHYNLADDSTKIILLDIMASFQTQESFEEIKTMLLNNPPHITSIYDFTNRLVDTPQLTATIFPELLPLIKDSAMSPAIIKIANTLLDSGLIDKTLLQPYQQNILKLAREKYLAAKKDDADYDATNYSVMNILGKMNNTECNTMLQKWSLLKDSYLQLHAVIKLLQNKQAINPVAIKALAADKATRTDLYDTLKAFKQQALFPAQYLNQRSFAESLVYFAASDDEEPDAITYLTQKTINFAGKQSRFYFFKVTYGEGDDATKSLACAGPFNMNVADVSITKASGNIYYDEDFDPSRLNEQMDALITQIEDQDKDDE